MAPTNPVLPELPGIIELLERLGLKRRALSPAEQLGSRSETSVRPFGSVARDAQPVATNKDRQFGVAAPGGVTPIEAARLRRMAPPPSKPLDDARRVPLVQDQGPPARRALSESLSTPRSLGQMNVGAFFDTVDWTGEAMLRLAEVQSQPDATADPRLVAAAPSEPIDVVTLLRNEAVCGFLARVDWSGLGGSGFAVAARVAPAPLPQPAAPSTVTTADLQRICVSTFFASVDWTGATALLHPVEVPESAAEYATEPEPPEEPKTEQLSARNIFSDFSWE